MGRSEQPHRDFEALRERLSRLSEASLRINESLDFDEVLQGVLDSARSLTDISEPMRVPDLVEHVRSLGFSDFSRGAAQDSTAERQEAETPQQTLRLF